MSFVEEYGLIGLFLFSLLAATIIPVSSESAVLGALYLEMSPESVLLWASLGNILGTIVNYAIGTWIGLKWLKAARSASAKKAIALTQKYGWLSLFLSWAPFIGDPVTIIAGVMRWNIWLFAAIVFSLRIFRYYLIIMAVS